MTNKQSKISSKLKKYTDNLSTNNKVNPEAEYFATGPNMETDGVTSGKTTIKNTINSVMCSQVFDASSSPYHSKSKKMQGCTKFHQDM